MAYFNSVFILALATVASVAVPGYQPPKCTDRVCPAKYDPVCARLKHASQKIYRTFSNECMLHDENCHYPITHYEGHGFLNQTCAQQKLVSLCSTDCSELLVPVCGLQQQGGQKFYITFRNKCFLWQANCHNPDRPFEELGKIGQSCDKLGFHHRCPKTCTPEHKPVCGLLHSEGSKIYETFGNVCLLQETMCQNPETDFVQEGGSGKSCSELQLFNKCAQTCSFVSEPRCGHHELSSGQVKYRTFANNCLLMQHNCLHPRFSFHTVGEVGTPCMEED